MQAKYIETSKFNIKTRIRLSNKYIPEYERSRHFMEQGIYHMLHISDGLSMY